MARLPALPAVAVAALGMVSISAGSVLGATSELGPVATSAWRMLLAVPLCALIMFALPSEPASAPASAAGGGRRGADPVDPLETWRLLARDIVPGVIFAAMLVCFYTAQRQSSVANASIMHNVAPLFVIGVTAVVLRRRPAALCLVGIAFAIVGPALLFADSARFSLDRFEGDLIGLAAAVFYAAYFIEMGRHPSPQPAAERMINVSIGAAVVLVPAALWLEPQFFPHDIGGWWTLFGVAMFAQAVGQVLLVSAIVRLRPFGVAAVAPLEPVGTTLLAAMLLAQPVSGLQFAGLTAAIVGVVLCQASRDARPMTRLPALPPLAIRGALRRRLQPVAATGRRGQPGSVPAIARS